MKTKILCCTAALLVALCVVSCSPDEENTSPTSQTVDPNEPVPDPEGTITVNMRNYDNGSTYLGGIYIDGANNFTGQDYRFVDLGAMHGLGNITTPVWEGLSSTCAVVPGHGYYAYRYLREFPSGKWALTSFGEVYKIYVDSWILSGGHTILGAVVKYLKPTPESYGLPADNSTIGPVIRWTGMSVSIDLSDETAAFAESDFEFEGYSGDQYSDFTVSRSGKTLTFTLTNPRDYRKNYTTFYYPGRVRIRVKGFYTEVYIEVEREPGINY